MISNRLKAISNYIEIEDRVVDIGCDHALLSIYLYQNNLCSLIIASDKNPNALKNAIKNIKEYNLSEKIPTILSDGVENIDIKRENINTLIIAGMGTNTILKILDNPKCQDINKLVIQSNKEYFELRKEITNKGYILEDETILFENKKYYLTCLFKKGIKKYTNYNYQWGIIKNKNLEYYKFLYSKYRIIYDKIPYTKIILKLRTKKLIKELKKIIKSCS